MITLEQAEKKLCEIVAACDETVRVLKVWEIQFDDPLYVVMCVDKYGNKIYPGERFPSIRKRDGEVVNWEEPCPS